jgi:hypothetical protein
LPHVKVHIISIPFSNSLPSDVLGGWDIALTSGKV